MGICPAGIEEIADWTVGYEENWVITALADDADNCFAISPKKRTKWINEDQGFSYINFYF